MHSSMIAWFGHAAFRISAEKRVYIDPGNVKKDSLPADIILISHHHSGHCSVDDIEKIVTPKTVIVGNATSIGFLRRVNAGFSVARSGQKMILAGMSIEVLPAYGRGHAKDEEGLGFIITVSGQRIYHAGDTGCIPEMNGIRCNVALLPVAGCAVKGDGEAVRTAELLRPDLVIPMHYGSRSGSIADAHSFLGGVVRLGLKAKLLTPA